MEQVKQKLDEKQQVHERPTTRQEQSLAQIREELKKATEEITKNSQLLKERPAVKSDFSSPKVERQGNTVQEKTVQKPATSTTTADRTSQRPKNTNSQIRKIS
ncbi:hypothetical protein EfmJHP36_29130 [Enterococcus faecium]|nr:hypothetical protein EfmJHP36_29130 [Enterococcus faecium]